MTNTTTLTLVELEQDPLPGFESYSPFCLKAHRLLALAGLPYKRLTAGTPALRARYNATGQVPVLLVGEEPVPDSSAIARRVMALAPGRVAESPEAWLWEELADTALSGFLVAARWADDRNWPSVRAAYFASMPALIRAIVPSKIRKRVVGGLHARDVWRAGPEACWARFSRLLDDLEGRAPESGFWLGERVSIADVALFAQLQSFRTPLTPWQRAEVERRPRLRAWLDRVDAATARRTQGSTTVAAA